MTSNSRAAAMRSVEGLNDGGSEMTIAAVRQLRAAGLTYTQICLYFGVKMAAVWSFVRDNGLVGVQMARALAKLLGNYDKTEASLFASLVVNTIDRSVADRFTPEDVDAVIMGTHVALVDAVVGGDPIMLKAIRQAGFDLSDIPQAVDGRLPADVFFQFANGYVALYRDHGDTDERWSAICKIYGEELACKAAEILQIAEIAARPVVTDKSKASPGIRTDGKSNWKKLGRISGDI